MMMMMITIIIIGLETGNYENFKISLSLFLENTGEKSQVRPRPLLSTSFPIHYSVTTPQFDSIQSELLHLIVKINGEQITLCHICEQD